MKARILIMLMVAVLAVGAFATGTTESGGPVELRLIMKNSTLLDPYEAIFNAYEEETGNAVEVSTLPTAEDYGALILTRFATDDYPDVFEMDPGTKQYIKFRADETLYDWTDDPIIDRLTESTREFQTLDGKIYGIPWGSTGNLGIYYNKDVFEAIDADVPESYDELLEIARAAKDAGFIPFYEAANTAWPLQIYPLDGWTTYVDPEIGDTGVQALEMNELQVNEIPALRGVFQRYYDLIDNELVQENVMAGTYEEQQELFGTGEVAMVSHGAWFLNVLADKFGEGFVTDSVGWFPQPAADGPGTATLYPAGQFLVPRVTDNVETATDLVRFMTQTEMLETYYAANPGIPVWVGVEVSLYPAQETVQAFAEAGNAKINIQNRLSSSFTDFPQLLQQMFLDGDVDDALDTMDENYRLTGESRQLPGF